MSQYSRLILHFLHAVANNRGAGWSRVHAFTFGTRLTNITRHLNTRDVDAALKSAGADAQDWEGGTFDRPDFAKLAEAGNCYGENVFGASEVGPALKRGLDQVHDGTPAVVAVHLPSIPSQMASA